MSWDIIILHMCTINEDHMICGSWNIRYDRHYYLLIWAIFALSDPGNLENQNFEKFKTLGYNVILHMCIINDNHIICAYWEMEGNRQYFLWFWTTFCTFTPLPSPPPPPNNPEKQNFEKRKKKRKEKKKNTQRYYHFTHVYQKSWSYATLYLRQGAWQIQFLLFILGYFLPYYPPHPPPP